MDKTPLQEDNQKILKSCDPRDYENSFSQMYRDFHEYSYTFGQSKEKFTNKLLQTGARENPQEIYSYLDMLSSRLEKISIIKRMCNMLGLQHEMDNIIHAEMELIYKSPVRSNTNQVSYGDTVAGDLRNER